MNERTKFYCIVNGELAPGYQAVQAAHALVEFALTHPEKCAKWNEISKYMCILSVENEQELQRRLDVARKDGITVVPFYEPDIGDALTAIALEPTEASRVFCSDLMLALRGVK